jgi:hypothetical protein
MSIKAIARRLTENRVPTWVDTNGKLEKKMPKGEWPPSSVANMLGNEVYRGRWYYAKSSDEPILVNVPPIVDTDTWKMVQERKAENKKRRRKEPIRGYLLAGRVTCHHCQAPAHSKAVGRKYLYYICSVTRSKARVGVTCKAPNLPVDRADAAVWEWIKSLILDPDRLEKGLKEYQESKAAEAQPLREELARLEKLAQKKAQALARAKELYYDGIHTKEEYAADKRQIEADLADLEMQSAKAREKLDTIALSPERIRDILEFAEKVLPAAHSRKRKKLRCKA